MLKSLRAAVVCAALLIFAAAAWAASGDIFALRSGSSDVFRVTSAGDVVPGADNTYDLGTAALSWQDFRADGTSTLATVSTTGNTTLGDATTDTVTVTAQVASDVLPSTDNARDLGSAAKSWNEIFADGLATLGSLTVTGASSHEGDTDLGNATTDTLTITAQIDSDVLPSTDAARDLGSAAKSWDELFVDGLSTLGSATVTGRSTLASMDVKRVTSAVGYTALTTDYYIGITNTGSARTVDLPAAATAGEGFTIVVKDESGAANVNNITIDAATTELIDGAQTKVISSAYGSVTIICTGTAWFSY